MSCIEPGASIEAYGLLLPVGLDEAALAIEEIVVSMVNAAAGEDSARAIIAITDRIESCSFESTYLQSVPQPGDPIMPLEGEPSSEAVLDTWYAKGSVLSDDGTHTVFIAFVDVMRQPLQGSWTARCVKLIGSRQSVASLLEEMQYEPATG